MLISYGSSDVCSSDLYITGQDHVVDGGNMDTYFYFDEMYVRLIGIEQARSRSLFGQLIIGIAQGALIDREAAAADTGAHLIAEPGETCEAIIQFVAPFGRKMRSEEQKSELQSLNRMSDAVLCLKKNIQKNHT